MSMDPLVSYKAGTRLIDEQDGKEYFTSWEPILSAKYFATNSVSQMRQKTSKIVVIWVFFPMTRNF